MWWMWVGAALAQAPVLEPGGLAIVEQPAQTYDFEFDDPPGRCLVRVALDASGKPTGAQAKGCLLRYAKAAEAAVQTWLWSAPGTPAVTQVDVAFTPKGTSAVEAADTCTYTVSVASNGAVTADGKAADGQCQLWPARHVQGAGMATGRCASTVPATVGRTAEDWATHAEDCTDAAAEAATELMRDSLFTFGATETRFVVTFPAQASGPPVAGEVDIPDVQSADLEDTRISSGEEAEQEAEGLEVPEHEVPEVTFPIFPSKEDLGKASDDD